MSRLLPFIVGLTGGIGSGKSTVCRLFAELGTEIIDADQSSRRLVAPGSAALQQLQQWFGAAVVQPDGNLNRAYLRTLVFTDAEIRQRVEALLHPLIRNDMLATIARSHSSWLIVAAPLLLEKNSYTFIDRVLVVDAAESLQIARTCHRDNTSEADVRSIMAIQLNRQQRLRRADDVIHNDGDVSALLPQVKECVNRYEQLAQARQHAINSL